MNSGDIIACGTNHEGLGPLRDGEMVDFEIRGIGRMRLSVRDRFRRSWEKGIGHHRFSPAAARAHSEVCCQTCRQGSRPAERVRPWRNA